MTNKELSVTPRVMHYSYYCDYNPILNLVNFFPSCILAEGTFTSFCLPQKPCIFISFHFDLFQLGKTHSVNMNKMIYSVPFLKTLLAEFTCMNYLKIQFIRKRIYINEWDSEVTRV